MPNKITLLVPANKFKGWGVIEVYIAKICGQNRKVVCNPDSWNMFRKKFKMLLKWANRWGLRSITFKDQFIDDIKLLFRFLIFLLVLELLYGRKTEPLYVGIFHFSGVFCSSSPPPPDKNSKLQERYHLMSLLSKVSWTFVWNGSGRSWKFWLKKGETGRKYKDLRSNAVPISWCFLRKRSIMWAGQIKFSWAGLACQSDPGRQL